MKTISLFLLCAIPYSITPTAQEQAITPNDFSQHTQTSTKTETTYETKIENLSKVTPETSRAIRFVFEFTHRAEFDSNIWNKLVTASLQSTDTVQKNQHHTPSTVLNTIRTIYSLAKKTDCFDMFITVQLPEPDEQLLKENDININVSEIVPTQTHDFQLALEFQRNTQEYDQKVWAEIVDLTVLHCQQLLEQQTNTFDITCSFIEQIYESLQGKSWAQAVTRAVYTQGEKSTIAAHLDSRLSCEGDAIVTRMLTLEKNSCDNSDDDENCEIRACSCEEESDEASLDEHDATRSCFLKKDANDQTEIEDDEDENEE